MPGEYFCTSLAKPSDKYSETYEIVAPPLRMAAAQQILTSAQMDRKIKRMAVQIHEHNFESMQLTLVGVASSGYALAQRLQAEMVNFPLEVNLVRLALDKSAKSQPLVDLDTPVAQLAGAPLVLVDDVLNTGRTLWYALNAFSGIVLPKVEVAVMVARNHSLFPIKANYVGYSISTTLSDHIVVELEDQDKLGAYLH